MKEKTFPKDFLWGVATSSYQVEGSPLANGAGSSIWHEFSHDYGKTYHGDTGDIACDHYNLYKEDIQLMKSLGLRSYRFSISWPKIFPYGKGKINEKGVDFYDRLVDELLKAGIVPFATIYHWDLPTALQDLGGWLNRDIICWFGDYADYLFRKFGDRVKYWSTLNEPLVISLMGYMFGNHAPGMKNISDAFSVIHNELRAHSMAVKNFRQENTGGKIGITLSNEYHEPLSDSQEDLSAAAIANEFSNYPLFLDPIFTGSYPKNLRSLLDIYMPEGYEKDLDEIKEPIDFVIAYYSKDKVKADKEKPFGFKKTIESSEEDFNMYSKFYNFFKKIQDTYNLEEIYFTIGGFDAKDEIEKGSVHDYKRIEYLKSQTNMIIKAVNDGIKLNGCFIWSLMDNFEWSLGYSKRFGIVYVDYDNQERIIKDSGFWYSKIIKQPFYN